jgi:hypothetical protein
MGYGRRREHAVGCDVTKLAAYEPLSGSPNRDRRRPAIIVSSIGWLTPQLRPQGVDFPLHLQYPRLATLHQAVHAAALRQHFLQRFLGPLALGDVLPKNRNARRLAILNDRIESDLQDSAMGQGIFHPERTFRQRALK